MGQSIKSTDKATNALGSGAGEGLRSLGVHPVGDISRRRWNFFVGGGLGSVQDLDRRGSELRARGGSWKKQVEESSS